MTTDATNIFHVGLVLSVEATYKAHLPTSVLGWDRDQALITRAIFIQGQPAKLKANDRCKVRFLKEGVAYGFSSDILAVQFFPFPLMFMKYPAHIETLKLRVAQRFKTNLPVLLLDTSASIVAADATMLDISENGCGLKVPVQKAGGLSPDESYTIALRIMDREFSAACSVRKLERRGDYAWFLGLEFSDMQTDNKESLMRFIDFLRRHTAV